MTVPSAVVGVVANPTAPTGSLTGSENGRPLAVGPTVRGSVLESVAG